MDARGRFKVNTKRAIRHLNPKYIVKSRQAKSVIDRFVTNLGLVYFGMVDHRDDDHALIRGFTVSATQRDENYSVGSLQGYDVALVTRNDVIKLRGAFMERRCHWVILTLDLHTSHDIPHFFIGHRTHQEQFLSSFKPLQPLSIGSLASYPSDFVRDYAVFGKSTHAVEIEHILSPAIASVIASHFGQVSVEIEHGTVYLYLESQYPTRQQLDLLVANGLWLAQNLDASIADHVAEHHPNLVQQ